VIIKYASVCIVACLLCGLVTYCNKLLKTTTSTILNKSGMKWSGDFDRSMCGIQRISFVQIKLTHVI
jgi:hypothetical protein